MGDSRPNEHGRSAVICHQKDSEPGADLQHATGLEDTTLEPGHPRSWHAIASTWSLNLWKQLLGLNPFRSSYVGLYTTLSRPRERLTIGLAVTLAVAAGIPLPIIGVIFGRLISSFPPSPEELHEHVIQLLSVAVAYFAVTSMYTILFSRTGERVAMQLRRQVLETLLYADQGYLDVKDLDCNALLRDNIDSIQVGCSEKVGIFIQSISYFVAAFVLGFILNAKLTGILFAAVIPSMAIVVSLGSTCVSRLNKSMTEHANKANALCLSALHGIRIVQAFNMFESVSHTHRILLRASSRLSVRKAVASALELAGAYFVAYAANSLAFYVGSKLAAAGAQEGTAGFVIKAQPLSVYQTSNNPFTH